MPLIENINTLRKMKTLEEVIMTDYYQKHFVDRYINNIPLMAFELFGIDITWQQEEVIDSHNWKGGRTVVASGHGCFGRDTEILMYDGTMKLVQDIEVGDVLIGDDGKSKRNVLELYRDNEEMFEFQFNDNTKQVYNLSHKLCLVATQSKGKTRVGDKSIVLVKDYLEWSKEKKRVHTFYTNGAEFEEKKVSIDPYLLGVWLGDGNSLDATIHLGKKKNEVYKKIEHLTTTKKWIDKDNCFKIGLNIKKELKEYNLIRNKHIPIGYKTNSVEVRREILCGLLDTDGSVDKRTHKTLEITQKSYQLILDIRWLAKSLGLNCKKIGTKIVKDVKYYKIVISGDNIEELKLKRLVVKNNNVGTRKLSIKSVKSIGIDKYYGFELDGNHLFLDNEFRVLSNTGKTFTIGIMVPAVLLLFPLSIVRIQSPTMDQIKLSFKEIKSNFTRLKEKRKTNGEYKPSPWAFLVNYFQFNTKEIYVKGYKESWYLESRTAPRGEGEKLAGQHNRYYFLVFDEMSGIEDSHINPSLGALSETINSCIGFSQHSKNSGKFHDFMTNQSIEKGGSWKTHILNSEESPRVSNKALRDWKSTYNDNEYRVRVKGLPPLSERRYVDE